MCQSVIYDTNRYRFIDKVKFYLTSNHRILNIWYKKHYFSTTYYAVVELIIPHECPKPPPIEPPDPVLHVDIGVVSQRPIQTVVINAGIVRNRL